LIEPRGRRPGQEVDIAFWLRGLGLEQYAPAFHENDIDGEVLHRLTGEDLRELGVTSIGHRRRLLDAIAALGSEATASSEISARADAERRQLTVMFCDLVGSTALSARLDPEDLREVIAAYHRTTTDAVKSFDGFVAKYMGDGVLVYFGYPRAHEDDAERAVRAGLGVVDAVGRLGIKSIQLQARVGIATGLVVVGDLIGEGSAQEQSVVGETPNLAARLQALAEPRAVVIAATTRRLLGDLFEYSDLGAVEVKGIAAPVPAWRVLGPSSVASRFEALRGAALSRLIGRDEEVDLLLRRWARAKAGDGQIVLISGEPGIGKSRITAELEDRLRAEPHLHLRYFCSPYCRDSALYPFIDQLWHAAEFARDDPPMAKLEKLEAVLFRSAQAVEDVALLADLMSLPVSARHPLPNLSPQRKKERTLEALLRRLGGQARQQPVLMVFEDAHWVDPTSRELLDLIVEHVRSLPVLLIVTFRPEFQPPWIGQPQVSMLTLNRLDRDDRTALIAQVAGDRALTDRLAEQIAERTDGVPLFVEELTKNVLETGMTPLAIPTSLHDSLLARLDRLGPAKQIAQLGAAIGRQFSQSLVEAVIGLSAAQLGDSLEQLVRSELVFSRGVPPRAEYIFKHALVQDAAYSTLLRSRRQELHARIAVVLQCEHDVAPEMLAHHYGESGDAAKAARYWLKAGRLALRRSANTEAITHLTKGLEALNVLPESAERSRRELELQLALGPTLSATRGWSSPEAERAYRRAEELAQGLGADRERFDAVWGLWMIHNTGNAPEKARGITTELFRIANQLDDAALRMEAHHASWACANALGDHAATVEHMRQGLALYECDKHRAHAFSYGGHDTAVCAKAIGGRSLWALGYPEQATRSTDASIVLAETLGHAPSLAHALLFASLYRQICRDAVAVLTMTERLIALALEHRLALYHAVGCIARGWALAKKGQLSDGLGGLRRDVEAYDVGGPKNFSSYCRTVLAEVYLGVGDTTQALQAVDDALRVAEQISNRTSLSEVFHLKGRILASIAPGREPDAEACFLEALRVARMQQAKSLELRAAVSLSRLRRDQGRLTEARDLLAPVYGWFTEGFDTQDLKEAKALLDELGMQA
jgi:class 3 adenylate cyclase/predicted ATPase